MHPAQADLASPCLLPSPCSIIEEVRLHRAMRGTVGPMLRSLRFWLPVLACVFILVALSSIVLTISILPYAFNAVWQGHNQPLHMKFDDSLVFFSSVPDPMAAFIVTIGFGFLTETVSFVFWSPAFFVTCARISPPCMLASAWKDVSLSSHINLENLGPWLQVCLLLYISCHPGLGIFSSLLGRAAQPLKDSILVILTLVLAITSCTYINWGWVLAVNTSVPSTHALCVRRGAPCKTATPKPLICHGPHACLFIPKTAAPLPRSFFGASADFQTWGITLISMLRLTLGFLDFEQVGLNFLYTALFPCWTNAQLLSVSLL